MKTNTLRLSFTRIRGNEKTVIKLTLDDDCKNGHEDFSLTADIYEKTLHGWRDSGGGCCHDHILNLKPELAPFAALHLSTFEGVPMHAFANAWYWFQGAFPESASSPYNGGTGSSGKPPTECAYIFAEHIRATSEEVQAIAAGNPRTQDELQGLIEDMGFPARWKAEAQAAIATLEGWTGNEFESKATRGRYEPLSSEVRALIAERKASGYYLPENVAKRDLEAKAAAKVKKLATIESDYAAKRKRLEQDYRIDRWMAETFDHKPNVIWYAYSNELAANWTSTEKLLTREEFDALTASIPGEIFDIPPKFVFKDKPHF